MKKDTRRPLELLAPARDAETGRQAILHGADAVYIGASGFGARKAAGNSVEDIAGLVKFAHQYRARVYVTVNTIVYEYEVAQVEALCRELYEAGVDALIVQDMALLEMKLPPTELHASTQCDTRSAAKARFLQDVGFSQIVLACELSIKEIREICEAVTVPVECFIHGALCVSYSGRCHASLMATGRSANRGECSQMCRLPYTLTDASGKILAKDRYLLSLRDFNATESLADLVDAGASSFKIEGRLKDVGYVKNITAWYRRMLDEIIAANPDKYCRSSFGRSEISFEPDPKKSFNRGFTDYFLTNRRPKSIASLLTPKSLGEPVEIRELHNGDGVSWFEKDGTFTGALVNGITPDGRLITSDGKRPPRDAQIYRTSDRLRDKELARPTAKRTIGVRMTIDETGLTAVDERGVQVRLPLDCPIEKAEKPFTPASALGKLGNSCYRLESLTDNLPVGSFIPASSLTALRRRAVEALYFANGSTYPLRLRRTESTSALYPEKKLTYADNVANSLADSFYKRHGVSSIQPALEKERGYGKKALTVMTTRHCILRELGLCLKTEKGRNVRQPLMMTGGKQKYRLNFDCPRCEMQVISNP